MLGRAGEKARSACMGRGLLPTRGPRPRGPRARSSSGEDPGNWPPGAERVCWQVPILRHHPFVEKPSLAGFPALACARAFAGQSPAGDCSFRLSPPAPPFKKGPSWALFKWLVSERWTDPFVARNGPLDHFVGLTANRSKLDKIGDSGFWARAKRVIRGDSRGRKTCQSMFRAIPTAFIMK
jgi:hypothetical protein